MPRPFPFVLPRTGARQFVGRRPRARIGAALALLVTFGATLAALGSAQNEAGAPEDPDAILERVLDNMRGGSQRATLELTVERPDDTRSYQLEIVSDGVDRSLVQVVAPPRDAGQAFLSVGNDLFVFNPRLGRVLRLPPSGRSNAFLGSDLAYDDLSGDDWREQYEASLAESSDASITLALTPLPRAATPYGELRFRVGAADFAPRELTYFDQRGEAVKRMTVEDLRETDEGRLVPTRVVVTDLTEDGGRTVAEWHDLDTGADIPASCFRQEALERGCP